MNDKFFSDFVSVNEELFASGPFETMTIDTDEDEHSIEMQLPYIAKAMERFVKHGLDCMKYSNKKTNT